MVRAFARALLSDWVSLVSGIASFVLAAAAAIFNQSLSAWWFWPAAYVCIAFAAFRAWAATQTKLLETQKKLAEVAKRPAYELDREAEIESVLSKLDPLELLALRRIWTTGWESDESVQAYLRHIGHPDARPDLCTVLGQKCEFVAHQMHGDAWCVTNESYYHLERFFSNWSAR